MWDDNKFAAFDFETSGTLPEYALQPHRVATGDSWVTCLGLAGRSRGKLTVKAALMPDKARIEHVLTCAARDKITLVGWNIAFDIAWCCAYGLEELVMQISWLDGMLLWRHIEIEPEYDITDRNKKRSYGLKAAVAQYFPQHAGYEADIDFHDPSPAARERLAHYCKKDVVFSLALVKKFYNLLAADPKRLAAALLESRSLPLVATAWLEGMLVDVESVSRLGEDLTEVSRRCLEELAPHGVTEKIVRSPKQLASLIFKKWGLQPIKQTDSGADSTDKEVLHELAFEDPRAKTLKEYREALGNRTKFSDTLIESIAYNGDGRTRPQAAIFGTYSGRMTYYSKQGKNKDERQTGFALHQMKRGKDFRNSIKAPPGYTVCEFDAVGQEVRWMAIASGDTNMLTMCLPGEDIHSFMGSRIVGRDYNDLVAAVHAGEKAAKDARQLGKVANLSCVAYNTEILTHRGPKKIQCVELADKIWDGVEFVNHEGVICNGHKQVITYRGLTATEDHQVLCDGTWIEFGRAAAEGRRIDASFWQMDLDWDDTGEPQQPAGSDVPMPVWCGEDGVYQLANAGEVIKLSSVCDQSPSPKARSLSCDFTTGQEGSETCERDVPKVQQPERSVIQQLRRARDSLRVFFRRRGLSLGNANPATPHVHISRHRQEGQQRTLCSGEFATGDAATKPLEQEGLGKGSLAGGTRPYSGVGTEPLQPALCREVCSEGFIRGRNTPASVDGSERETQGVAQNSGKALVYDILNCGPRNRFVANGLIVHNCQYRTSAGKLQSVARVQYDIPMDLSEAKRIRNTYLQSYPNVPKYWEEQIADCRARKYVETYAGRRVQLLDDFNGSNGWSLASTAINYRIQGTGADQKYLALAVLRPYMVTHGIRFAWELHDGIYLYVPDSKVQQCVPEIQNMLANLPYQRAWGFTPPIPLPWDAKVGKRWGDLQEWKEN